MHSNLRNTLTKLQEWHFITKTISTALRKDLYQRGRQLRSQNVIVRKKLHSASIATEESHFKKVSAANLVEVEKKWAFRDGNFAIKTLDAVEEISQAQELLYDVYIKEQGWMFAEGNPTGFRITNNGRNEILTDDLESNSTWFGATFQDQVVACIRLVHRDDNGDLDMTRYPESETPLTKRVLSPAVNPKLFEAQRAAVSPLFRKRGLIAKVFTMLTDYATEQGGRLIATSECQPIIRLIESYSGYLAIDEGFDYGDGLKLRVFCWPNAK